MGYCNTLPSTFQVYRVGDQVQAKWTDCKMYLAKIDEVMADGKAVYR